jgi:hypothetical protein
MVELVERMSGPSTGSGQALDKKLPKAKDASKTAGVLRPTQFLRQIAATDRKMGGPVYELCEPTDREVRVVEANHVSRTATA